MNHSIALPISEPSQAGEARRTAVVFASRLGFNETQRGKVALVVTEVANNLVRHAQDGVLLLQALEQSGIAGVEIIALDKGPGINNLDECLRDGFSTGGTPGNGLGAIERLSALFDIHSVPSVGTAILSRFWASPLPQDRPQDTLNLGTVCLPKTGEEVSGDTWASTQNDRVHLLLVADGLGHGHLAAQASLEAARVFRENAHQSPKEIMEAAHAALRSTRGAAVAIAAINFERQVLHFAGIGNIAGTIITPAGNSNLVSHNGTVGHEVRKIQEFTYPWSSGGLLVMHSDGLKSQWRLDRYPGLFAKHPSLIAGVLYRDFNRGRDDVTVLVAREETVI
ncbi:MAG TPA: ATP-binding SpoIIE family protein phosphatase [Chroococcales cyanobacterium]|jgi:anti-sigma regulatory factor (Ser/Thr protein kinase)